MAQINHVFGDTLEFSTTVKGGKIESQELVSSSKDCIISFKLDKNFLCPKVLRDLANKIDVEKGVKLTLASQEQASEYVKNARESGIITSGLFESSKLAAYLAIAEYAANIDGFTLYDSRVEVVPTPVVEDDEDEDEDEDDDYTDGDYSDGWEEDDDDEDPNGYDDEDDEDYGCDCDVCRSYKEEDDEDDEDEDDEDDE